MDASTSTESPDTHMDFNIPVERSDDDWDLDNPFHAVELVSLDRKRHQRLHHHRIIYCNENNNGTGEMEATGALFFPEDSLMASAEILPGVATTSTTNVPQPGQEPFTPIRHLNLATPPVIRKYDYCGPIIRLEDPAMPEPDQDEDMLPCAPAGGSPCWRINAGPEMDPSRGDDYFHRMLLDLGSPSSHLYHTDCVIRSPLPAEDPWPSNLDFSPGSYKILGDAGVPRYVRKEGLALALADPLKIGAKPKHFKHWIAYADKSKYQIQLYVFKEFYFPGFVRTTEEGTRQMKRARIEDIDVGLNVSVNEIGFKSDMDNSIEGILGLSIPGRKDISVIDQLCRRNGNKSPGFLLHLHKNMRSFLVLNPSARYLGTLSPEWSNYIDVDPTVLENHWYIVMTSVTFLGQRIELPAGRADRLIELDTGSAYCFLYPTIFARLSQRAKMLYMADENLYYLPEDYHADPSSLQITIATSRLPFVLDLPLGSKNGSKRRIDGRRYIVSYFQPQTLDTDGDEDMEGHCGFPGNVFGSAFFYYYSIYFGLPMEGRADEHSTIRISTLRDTT